MAASTANMVKSKSGKMYEASSPQGKMIVTAATTGKDADFDTGSSTKEDAPETMLATLQAIYEETQESVTYQIVGSEEANIKDGLLSITSPVGKALIGKTEGNTVEVRTPKGEKDYEILRIEFK